MDDRRSQGRYQACCVYVTLGINIDIAGAYPFKPRRPLPLCHSLNFND
jgi:hypothetical protein